jgi:hypothetical protein
MEMTPKQEALASKPEDMPDVLLKMLDQYTVIQVGAWILWWIKTYAARFELLDDAIIKHAETKKRNAEEAAAIQRTRNAIMTAKLREEADKLEQDTITEFSRAE